MRPLQIIKAWMADPSLSPKAIKILIGVLIGAALVVPLLLIAVPYIDFFNDMAVQQKVRPQMVWAVIDGEPVGFDQDFPEGTVPREEMPYPFSDPDPKRRPEAVAWLTRTDPPPPEPYRAPPMTVALMKRGEQVFKNVCVVCHGKSAFGNGTVTRMGFPAPPTLHSSTARGYSLEHIFHVVTLGQNVMPSHAWQIPVEDRWAVASYIKALQLAFHPGPEEAP